MLGMLKGDWVNVQSNGAQPLSKILQEAIGDAPDIDAVATRQPRELDILAWNYHDDDVAAWRRAPRMHIEDPSPAQKSSSPLWPAWRPLNVLASYTDTA